MTYYMLPDAIKGIIMMAFMLLFWAKCYLIIYDIHRHNNWKNILLVIIGAAVDLFTVEVQIAFIRESLQEYDFEVYGELPATLYFILLVLMIIYTIALIVVRYRAQKKRVTVASIKEAMDALPMGICCYLDNGQIIFHNMVFDRIKRIVFKSAPVNGVEMEKALIENGHLEAGHYEFVLELSENEIYKIKKQDDIQMKNTVHMLIATNITEEYKVAKALEQEKIKAEVLSERYINYQRRIKEITISEETLRAKLRIHDEIGALLISIKSAAAKNISEKEQEELLATIRKNIYFLNVETSKNEEYPYKQVFETAENVGVKLEINGELPVEKEHSEIIAAGIHECLTNTLRHAHGDCLMISVLRSEDGYTITYTNNGERPSEPIVEKGGLLILRRMVEDKQGTMKIYNNEGKRESQFKLEIFLKHGVTIYQADSLEESYGI